MNENTDKTTGTILIIEDRFEEKIGQFADYLTKNGYKIILAETLENAFIKMQNLLETNNIDGVILDFSFPTNNEDPSVYSNNLPNGIAFLDNFKFKLNTKQIPVIINSTGDKEYKEKYLEPMKSGLSMPLYNVDHERSPLAKSSAQAIQEIMELFNKRKSLRNITPDQSWHNKGGPFIRDKNGNIIGYR